MVFVVVAIDSKKDMAYDVCVTHRNVSDLLVMSRTALKAVFSRLSNIDFYRQDPKWTGGQQWVCCSFHSCRYGQAHRASSFGIPFNPQRLYISMQLPKRVYCVATLVYDSGSVLGSLVAHVDGLDRKRFVL